MTDCAYLYLKGTVMNEDKKHDTYPEHNIEEGEECWCCPEVKEVDGIFIFIHREAH